MYAVITANLNDKNYQFIGTQSEYLSNNNSQSPRIKIQPQASKQLGKETVILNPPKSVALTGCRQSGKSGKSWKNQGPL